MERNSPEVVVKEEQQPSASGSSLKRERSGSPAQNSDDSQNLQFSSSNRPTARTGRESWYMEKGETSPPDQPPPTAFKRRLLARDYETEGSRWGSKRALLSSSRQSSGHVGKSSDILHPLALSAGGRVGGSGGYGGSQQQSAQHSRDSRSPTGGPPTDSRTAEASGGESSGEGHQSGSQGHRAPSSPGLGLGRAQGHQQPHQPEPHHQLPAFVIQNAANQQLAINEQWRNIHVMLNCTLSMVEKTKQALELLEDGPRAAGDRLAEEWARRSIREAQRRIASIERKAEEAITEIKRKATEEIEKVVFSFKATRSAFEDVF